MKKADIIIVGGGVIGASIALRLLQEGAGVCLVDASTDIPPATVAAAGMLAPSFEGSLSDGPLEKLGRASLALWPKFSQTLETNQSQLIDLQLNGILGVHENDEGSLDRDALNTLEPALGEQIRSAVFVEGEGQVDPLKLTRALSGALRGYTSFSLVNDRVASIEAKESGVRVSLAKGGDIEAATLVLATGASKAIKANFSIPKIRTVKGEALAVRSEDRQIPLNHVVRAEGVYLCPKSDGRIVIGATELDGVRDLTVDDPSILRLKARAIEVVPAIKPMSEVARWAGLRPSTPDHLPIIGRSALAPATIFYAMGHYRNGILMAPKTAEIVNTLIQGTSDPDAEPFSPDRFGNLDVVHHDLAKF